MKKIKHIIMILLWVVFFHYAGIKITLLVWILSIWLLCKSYIIEVIKKVIKKIRGK